MKAILVPLKDPYNAKTRLSSLLSPTQRAELMMTMFADVTAALARTRKADCIFVATSYEPGAKIAQSLGFEVYREQTQISESHSVDEASRWLRGQGFDLVLRLPADIPLVRSDDVDDLLSVEISSPATLIVPSREGTGTNAIARTPPDLFPSHFGPNSFSLHSAEAATAQAQIIVRQYDRIALDIDEPADIVDFLKTGAGTKTFDFLTSPSVNIGR